MVINSFKDLEIWKQSINHTKSIYRLTNENKFSRDFALKDQIRRASISISSNIAEGFERSNNNEFIRFLLIAKASAGEVRSQLYVAKEIGYIENLVLTELDKELDHLMRKIICLIKYLKKHRTK